MQDEYAILKNVLVLIRGAGERTAATCKELVLEQGVPSEHVVIIEESPFSRSMRVSFETGIESGLPWSCCLDADVLLRPGALCEMLRLAAAQEDTVCEIQGFVLDKFFGGPRKAGNHLYRTSLLPQVIACIPEEGVDVRPEHHTLKKMREQGFDWKNVPVLVGVHDYEQFYCDIFRKCFVQAHKHSHYTTLFLKLWREGAQHDPDFAAALKGYASGIAYSGTVLIDKQQAVYQKAFDASGIVEKSDLVNPYPSLADVEAWITEWTPPDAYLQFYPRVMHIEGLHVKPVRQGRPSRWGGALPACLRTAITRVGDQLCHMGERFKGWADARTAL